MEALPVIPVTGTIVLAKSASTPHLPTPTPRQPQAGAKGIVPGHGGEECGTRFLAK